MNIKREKNKKGKININIKERKNGHNKKNGHKGSK